MPGDWHPTQVRRVTKVSRTSTQVAVVETDAGRGYLKALGNPAGEHALAREWVGTELAASLGLKTLDYAIMHYDGTPELRFHPPKDAPPGAVGTLARPGPAFITRAEKLATLEAGDVALQHVDNPEDFALLVVFDTWAINPDRYFPDEMVRHPNRKNVVFSREGRKRWLLRAIDHTHCITRDGHLSQRVARIDNWQDETLYGLFPEFGAFMRPAYIERAVTALRNITREAIEQAVNGIPPEWQVDRIVREAVVEFLWSRKRYVADNIIDWITKTLAQGGAPAGAEPATPGSKGQVPPEVANKPPGETT
jgi:hypothetical protein